jgi:homoserine O-acetyltransferase
MNRPRSFAPLRVLFLVAVAALSAVPRTGLGAEPPAAAPALQPLGTFSIVAFDPATGDLGVAVASKVLGAGSIVPFARANVGAIATQSQANTSYGPNGLDMLAGGRDAAATLAALTEPDDDRDHRQVGVVDAKGRVAAFTGERCLAFANHIVGDHFTVQGNILAGENVLKDMATAYETARKGEGSELADWLVAALAAADKAGGDKRGKQSAALLVVRDKAGYGQNDRYVDLRVEDHAEPIGELARLLELHKEFFRYAHEHPPVRVSYPEPKPGDFVIKNFPFRSGQSLPELKLHYMTIGTPRRDADGVVRNAILILHGTTGSGSQFLRPEFAEKLYGSGQPFDATKWFIVLPDGIGHGQSSKPSDGLHAKFPNYGYRDMIEAQRRLLVEGLGVDHLRLVIGTSMGGMHSWLWGQLHPDMMDGLIPLASLPSQISGRNRVWRRVIIDAIRHDPQWFAGEYNDQPPGLRTAVEMSYFMGSNPVRRQTEAGSLAAVDRTLERYVTERLRSTDANDTLYAYEASEDYDPAPGLEQIKAPLLAINFADDLINPPELGILEREIKRVPNGRAIMYPLSDETAGHGTHTIADVWKDELVKFMEQLPPLPNLNEATP